MGQRLVVQTGGNASNVAANSVTSAPTESAIYQALGEWLLSVLPEGAQVLRGQLNQTPAPTTLFAVMTIISKVRLATNASSYSATQRTVAEPTRVAVQVGLFGQGAGDAVHQMIALFRDENAAEFFRGLDIGIAPLHASEARQSGFVSAERQYEDQWSADLNLQVNFTLTLPQQTAISAEASSVLLDTRG